MQILPSGVAEAGARVWFFVLLVPFLNQKTDFVVKRKSILLRGIFDFLGCYKKV